MCEFKVGKEGEEEEEDVEESVTADEDPAAAAEAKQAREEDMRRSLYGIMSCMRDIRKRTDRTDSMFEPLKDTVAALQNCGINLGDQVGRLSFHGEPQAIPNSLQQIVQSPEPLRLRLLAVLSSSSCPDGEGLVLTFAL